MSVNTPQHHYLSYYALRVYWSRFRTRLILGNTESSGKSEQRSVMVRLT